MLTVLLSVALGVGHVAQDPLAEGRRLYVNLKYEKALVVLGQALVEPGITAPERAQVYLYTGLCLFMLGDEAKALAAFAEALTSDPGITLPPHPGPKAQRLLATARADSRPPSPTPSPPLEPPPKEEAAAAPTSVPAAAVTTPAPAPIEASAVEPAPGHPRHVWPLVVAGAAAGIAVGVGAFLGASAARDNQAAQAAAYGSDRQRLADAAGGKAVAANVLFGAAVACGGAGVVLLFTF